MAGPVDSDDELVTDLLVATVQLIAESGGWISPNAHVVAREGQLSLACDEPDGAPLLRIPRAVIVRVDEVTWGVDGDRLHVIDVPGDFGEREVEMLYLQAALHNQCGKLPWMNRTHPSLAPGLSSEAIEATRALVPSFRSRHHDVTDVLWANRCFRLPMGAGPARSRVLVPLVDLLNHHRAGSSGDWDGEAFAVAASRPFGSTECALNYGMDRDALEMAVAYGFIDESARVAHSAAVAIEVPGLGTVHVSGDGRSADGSMLPLSGQSHPDRTVLSRITFSLDGDEGLRAQVAAATGWSTKATARAIDGVREANVALVAELLRACDRLPASAAAGILAEAGLVQRGILDMGRRSVRP